MTKRADSKPPTTAYRWRFVLLLTALVAALLALALLWTSNESLPLVAPREREGGGLQAGSIQPGELPPAAHGPPAEPLSEPPVADQATPRVAPADVAAQVARLLAKSTTLDPRQLADMMRIARAPALPRQERIEAIYWLARFGSDAAIDVLEQLLASAAEPAIRSSVAEALGESGNDRATDILLGLLSDADLEVVLSAIEALASRHDPATRRMLLDLVADDQQTDEVRAAAAAALGHHDEVADDLLLAFADAQGAMAAGVLKALAQQDFVHSEPLFRKLLADPDTPFEVKLEAIGALGEGSPEAAGLLLELARADDDPELRGAAIDALAFADDAGSQRDAFVGLALGESSAEVRASLYNALSLYAGQDSAEPAVAQLVSNTLAETEPHTRLEGYRMVASMLNYEQQPALATTFDNSMAPWLQRSAEYGDDKYTRFISIDALRLANTVGSRQALSDLSYSANPAVAQAAQQALRLAEESAGVRALP